MAQKIVISGAAGRMGRRLLALAMNNPELELVGALDYAAHPQQGKTVREIEPEADSAVKLSAEFNMDCAVIIDFSTPQATVARAREAAQKGCALVVGTTGLSPEEEQEVAKAAQRIPIIHAANYSLGVNLLLKITAEVAKALGPDFDIEITEAHHNRKADAPSGTALAIAKSICAATGRAYPGDLVHGRSGRPGERTRKEIGMHAIRMGSVVGDHSAYYGSDFEIIEIAHRAQTRDVFAAGALRAALWLCGKKPGLYSMQDVLFG